MVQAVSCRPFTVETQIRSHVSPYELVVDKVVLWWVFVRIFLFSPVRISSPMLRTHILPYVALTRGTNRRRHGTFQKPKLFLEIGEHGIEKYFFSLRN
jgi:hypothetical protein